MSVAMLSLVAVLLGAPAAAPQRLLNTDPVALADGEGKRPDATLVRTIATSIVNGLKAKGVSFVAPAPTGAAAPQARPMPRKVASALAKAEAARRELDQSSAIRNYREAIDAMEADLGGLASMTPLVDARVALASLYVAAGEAALAEAELARALSLRPTLEIDLATYPPRVAEALTQLKNKPAPPPTKLSVVTEPAGATVFVDGISVGVTPLERTLPRGRHAVWVGKTGFAPKQQLIDAVPGAFVRVGDRLAEHPSAALGRQLKTALAAGDVGPSTLDVVRALVRARDADAALAIAVGPVEGGYAGVATLTVMPRAMVAFSVSSGLTDVAAIGKQVASALMQQAESGKSPSQLPLVAATSGPQPQTVTKAFSLAPTKGLVWMTATRRAAVAGATGPSAAGVVPEAEDEGGSALIWVGAGVGVAAVVAVAGVAAAAGGAGAYYFGYQTRALDISTVQSANRGGEVSLNP